MHIAFITVGDTARPTGGYRYNRRVVAGLRERDIAVSEIVPSAADLVAQHAAAAAFGATFAVQPFDLVVVDALARGVCAPWIDRWRQQRPVVAMIHELPSFADPQAAADAHNLEQEAALLRADACITVSRANQRLLEARGVPAERIAIVPPGIERQETTREKAPTSQPVRGLCVAQWIPRKGITTLVEAWLHAPRPRATLEMIGETDADPAYAAQVTALLADRPQSSVIVRGVVDDATLARAYAKADFFVLPSRYEGYGMVYAQALNYGLPVVACTVGPVPEIVGAAGLLVPPDNPLALAAALERIIMKEPLRRQLAQTARQRAIALPRWKDTVDVFAAVLRHVLQHPSP